MTRSGDTPLFLVLFLLQSHHFPGSILLPLSLIRVAVSLVRGSIDCSYKELQRVFDLQRSELSVHLTIFVICCSCTLHSILSLPRLSFSFLLFSCFLRHHATCGPPGTEYPITLPITTLGYALNTCSGYSGKRFQASSLQQLDPCSLVSIHTSI